MTLNEWLHSEQNYQVGLQLYDRFGGASIWKRILAQGETGYNREKLTELLTEMALKGVISDKNTGASGMLSQASPNSTLTAQLKEDLKSEWVPLYKEMTRLHAQLELLPVKQRGQAALQILDLEQKLNQVWDKEKFLDKHGKLPPVSITDHSGAFQVQLHDLSTPIGIKSRILNLRVSISKHRKNAARAADVKKWEAEKADLEENLKQLNNADHSGAF